MLDAVFEILAALPPVAPPPVIFLCVARGTKAVDPAESILLRTEFEGKMAAVRAFLDDRAAKAPRIDWSIALDDPSNCVSGDVETWVEQIEADGWASEPVALNALIEAIDVYEEVPFRFVKYEAQAKLTKFQRV